MKSMTRIAEIEIEVRGAYADHYEIDFDTVETLVDDENDIIRVWSGNLESETYPLSDWSDDE